MIRSNSFPVSRSLSLSLSLFAALIAAAPARADAPAEAARQSAKALYQKGRGEQDAHDCGAAIRDYTAAFDLTHNAGVLCYRAQCFEATGDQARAVADYQSFLLFFAATAAPDEALKQRADDARHALATLSTSLAEAAKADQAVAAAKAAAESEAQARTRAAEAEKQTPAPVAVAPAKLPQTSPRLLESSPTRPSPRRWPMWLGIGAGGGVAIAGAVILGVVLRPSDEPVLSTVSLH